MANYEELKRAVKQVIKPNGVQEITGEILQNVLVKMIDTFGDEYKCKGVAVTTTTPQVSGKTLYFASTPGVYSNFAGLTVAKGEMVALLYDNSSWSKSVLLDVTNLATVELLGECDVTALNNGRTYDLAEAIQAVPVDRRKGGLILKYVNKDTSEYEIYYNVNEQWSTQQDDWKSLKVSSLVAFITSGFSNISKELDNTIHIHDGSPNGELTTIYAALTELYDKGEDVYKKRLAVSFVDRKTRQRVIYFCKLGQFSDNADDWSKSLSGAGGGVALLPFYEYVKNASITPSTAAEGNVVYDEITKRFLCRADGNYCPTWIGQEAYGTPFNNGVEPKEGVIYYFVEDGSTYTWKNGRMIRLSTGDGTGLSTLVKQKVDEVVENAKRIAKGDKGEKGEKGEPGYFKLVNHGINDTTFALTPNTMHVWGEVPRLTLTLAPNTDTRFVAEYAFQFTCPAASGTELSLPSSIKWLGNVFAPKKGQTYQACIVNGYFLIGGTQ
jgi:hypothetical protein